MRALVADDDRVATTILARTLEGLHMEVDVVHDGAAAWRRLSERDGPDMAILDWEMPEVDGLELCRRIRRERGHLYVILLTSRDHRTDIVAGLEAGADDYVVKPFDHGEFRARVNVGLRVLTLQTRLAERVIELETALSQVKRLRGLLPICSYCKRIRGDDQYWQQVDAYIAEHTEAQFTHGICPPCSAKLLEEIAQEQRRRT